MGEAEKNPASFAVVIHDGGYERFYYGLLMASAAAAAGRRVHIMFAGEAVHRLVHPTPRNDEDYRNKALRVADLEDLYKACTELGVSFLVCETALAIAEIKSGQLREDLALETGGFVGFLALAGEGQIVFV